MPICQLSTQWKQSLQALVELLATEFDALKENKTEHIIPIVEQKSALLAQSELFEQQLRNKLSVADTKQLLAYLKSHCSDTSQLIALARQAQEANHRNGMLLQNMIRLNEYGLSILSGQAGQDKIYGAYGQLKSAEAQNTLATA